MTIAEDKLKALHSNFPVVRDDTCNFANGGYPIQRNKHWFESYKIAVIDIIQYSHIISSEPLSFNWFRTLDDSNSKLYTPAYRIVCICSICYKEWGQPYFANICKHGTKNVQIKTTINFRQKEIK